MSTSVKPSVTSNERGVEIEVRIKEVDPTKITVEKRYNSILVIGVKESGIKPHQSSTNNKNSAKDKSSSHQKSASDKPFEFEDEIVEVVNIFAPRDVSLARVMVTQADSKGRLFIKAP
jgi:putative lipoic acid-binding regulatory protein